MSLGKVLINDKSSEFESNVVISHMDTLSQLSKSNKCKEFKGQEVIGHIGNLTNLLNYEI